MEKEITISAYTYEKLYNYLAQGYYNQAWDFIARLGMNLDSYLNLLSAEVIRDENKKNN